MPSLPRKFRSYSHEALSVSWTRVTVLSVAETSPAAAGGIKPGDHLLTFNNEAVPSSETADWISRFVRNNGERPIRVLVRHDGVDEMRTVTPVIACAIPIGLITDSSLNAFTTGDRIVVHSSILRVARTDAQLALVLEHELAHTNLGHLDKHWPIKFSDGPVALQSMPVWCLVEYGPAAYLLNSSLVPAHWHSA
jgi:beta-barrel assembly-enhancing protease